MFHVKRNQAISVPFFLVDSTDHNTQETPAAVDVSARYRFMDESSWTLTTGQVTSKGRGAYSFNLTAAQTNRPNADFVYVECQADGTAIWRDYGQLGDELPGDFDGAITVDDAKRLAAIILSWDIGSMRAHDDAIDANLNATSGTLVKNLANLILWGVGSGSVQGSTATVKREDDTTTAFTRTVTYGDTGTLPITGLG